MTIGTLLIRHYVSVTSKSLKSKFLKDLFLAGSRGLVLCVHSVASHTCYARLTHPLMTRHNAFRAASSTKLQVLVYLLNLSLRDSYHLVCPVELELDNIVCVNKDDWRLLGAGCNLRLQRNNWQKNIENNRGHRRMVIQVIFKYSIQKNHPFDWKNYKLVLLYFKTISIQLKHTRNFFDAFLVSQSLWSSFFLHPFYQADNISSTLALH